jgi:tripartite-type tricarboxylate transporter receptor subunit TctC
MKNVHTIVRHRVLSVALALACPLVAFPASDAAVAQAWPTRTITAVVPLAAGSASDVMGRVVLDQVSRQVGQPIVVENRPGAGGTIGSNVVAKAAPDGYTILVYGALAISHALYSKLPYSTLDDFAPVIPIGQQPLVLVTAPAKGFKTLADLIAAAKSRPGALNYASAGIGSASHFAAERLRVSGGVEAQHVTFRGANEALTEVVGGRVDFIYIPIAPALPLINDGKLVALAVSTLKRAADLPGVPTTTDAGLADSAYLFWSGLFLPAKTPREIVVKLHQETDKALQVPAVQERLGKLGVEPMPMSLGEFEKYFRDDVAANVKLVKAANIPTQ